MATEREVRIVAEIMAHSQLIEQPKLPAECWLGLARSILTAVDQEREEVKDFLEAE